MSNIIYKSVGSFTVSNEYGLKLEFRFILIENTSKISRCHITLKFNDGRFRGRFITTQEMNDIATTINTIEAKFNLGTSDEIKGEFFSISETSGLNYNISADNYNGLVFKMKVKAEDYYYEFDITNYLETFKLFNKTDYSIYKEHFSKNN